jgi:hypothetical protein
MVFRSPAAPGKSSRFAVKVETSVLSSRKAAEPKLSVEFGPRDGAVGFDVGADVDFGHSKNEAQN